MANREVKYFKEHIRDTKICGYCHSKVHKGYLSVKMLKKHKCLQKQCPMLERYEDHSYWKQRAIIKARKKAKKEVIDNERNT